MQARGPLMIEHRLIEKMLSVIRRTLELADQKQSIDPNFVDSAVDFIRVYADRTHHGKEEDILFRNLQRKNISGKDKKLMNDLIEEHVFSRKTTKGLAEANKRYRTGDHLSFQQIIEIFKKLLELYPQHIRKEDNVFFPASRAYFSDKEDQAMLEEFQDFDRKMIHEKYENLIRELEEK